MNTIEQDVEQTAPGTDGPAVAEEVLRSLANPTNQSILNLLAVEPTYPRRVGDLLGIGETDVSRRLREMEALGIVAAEWRHIGKNVKVYELLLEGIRVRFTPEGLRLELDRAGQERVTLPALDPLPHHIPSVEDFVGRDAELDQLAGPAPVVLVEGLPGIGKTALVATYARRVRTEQPVFFYRFRGTESLAWLARRFAPFRATRGDRALLEAVQAGAPEADLHDLLLDALADPGTATIFDDVHTVTDRSLRTFLREAIEGVQDGKLVLSGRKTPRSDPSLDHVASIWLEGLTDEEARAFLAEKGVELDDQLMPRLRDEVGGHPLALNLLVETAHAQELPVEELLDRVPERDIEMYLLEEVFDHLSESEQRVLTQASIFQTTFTTDDLKAISTREPAGGLVKLQRRRLLNEEPGRYGLHEIVRNFCYQKLDAPQEFHERAADHFLDKGTTEARLEGMHHLFAAGKIDRLLSLLDEDLDLEDFDIIDTGYHNLYLQVLEDLASAGIADARRAALIEDELGDIRLHRGEPEAALGHYASALEHFETAGDADRRADLAWKRGLCHQALGDADAALACVEGGLEAAPDDDRARQRLESLRAQLV